MTEDVEKILSHTEDSMKKAIAHLEAEILKVRAGKASPQMLDGIQVEYYGNPTPIAQVANISIVDARSITIQPWEKNMLQKVEKAIRDCDMGLNPASQGEIIRVPMPALTEERRKEMIKIVKNEGEDAKVAIRNLRRDANAQLKDALKKHEIPEDDERKAQDDVQKLTDKFVTEVDKMLAQKEAELLQV